MSDGAAAALAAQIVEATVLHPGDKLIVRLGNASMMQVDRMCQYLSAALGADVPVAVLGGGDIELVVMRHEDHSPPDWITEAAPEPGHGQFVITKTGHIYHHNGPPPCGWSSEGGEPETWVKVAGNYGPVRVIDIVEAAQILADREKAKGRARP